MALQTPVITVPQTDTFDQWRVKTNQVIGQSNQTVLDVGDLALLDQGSTSNIVAALNEHESDLNATRTIELTGDVSGSANINCLSDISVAVTIEPNSVALGTDTTGNYVATISAGTGLSTTGANTGENIVHTISLNHLGIQNLTDPGADRIMFWDDSETKTDWLTVSSGLTLSGTTLSNSDRGSSQSIFKNIAVSGQSTIVADSNDDTLTLAAGGIVTITTSAATDTVTISVPDQTTETVYSVGSISGTATFDRDQGTIQKATVTGDYTFALSNMSAGQSITLIVTQDATGNHIMTPPASMKFAQGFNITSLDANATDILSIFYDGTTYYCALTTGYV